jgi:hypothetical protein
LNMADALINAGVHADWLRVGIFIEPCRALALGLASMALGGSAWSTGLSGGRYPGTRAIQTANFPHLQQPDGAAGNVISVPRREPTSRRLSFRATNSRAATNSRKG